MPGESESRRDVKDAAATMTEEKDTNALVENPKPPSIAEGVSEELSVSGVRYVLDNNVGIIRRYVVKYLTYLHRLFALYMPSC